MDEKVEEKMRKEAIRLNLSGSSPTEICRKLARSRRWFYKWNGRFETGCAQWYKECSRAPHAVVNKTDEKVEKAVLAIRSRLENSKYSQIGAFAIQCEMKKLGLKPLPTWTIDRILKRHDVVRAKQKYQPKNKNYPDVRSIFSDFIQQADLLGPRHIKNDGRFYSMNVIDLETHMAAVNPCRTKGDEDMAVGLLHAWKTIGKPEFVQFDNELSLHGSHLYPRSLGLVLRMCLALGVRVIFIPIGEPYRNGVVERFQHTFEGSFFRKQFFTSYRYLKQEARKFEAFFNRHHRTRTLRGKTPMEYVKSNKIDIRKLDRGVSLKDIDLSLADGFIHLIRIIRSDLKLNVFGEKFKVPKSVKHEYVIATIDTENFHLQVRYEGELVCWFEYRMPIEYRRN